MLCQGEWKRVLHADGPSKACCIYIYVFLLLVGFNIHCRHLLHRFKPLASRSKIHMQRLDPEGDKTLVQFTASQIIWSWDRQRSVVYRLLGKKQKHL